MAISAFVAYNFSMCVEYLTINPEWSFGTWIRILSTLKYAYMHENYFVIVPFITILLFYFQNLFQLDSLDKLLNTHDRLIQVRRI